MIVQSLATITVHMTAHEMIWNMFIISLSVFMIARFKWSPWILIITLFLLKGI